MNKRALSTSVMLAGILVFILGAAAATFIFALPRPAWTEIGPVADFPPRAAPYRVATPVVFFISNDGQAIIALAPQDPHPRGCDVNWDVERSQFNDPCLGSQYTYLGVYASGPSARNLNQYPIKVVNGTLFVDFSRPIKSNAPHD